MEASEAEEMVEEVVDLANLVVLGDDEVGLAFRIIPTADDNAPVP